MKNSPFRGKKAQVLLLKPLLGKGNPGDILEVKTHYALQVLVPNGTAIIYDAQAKNQHASSMKVIAKIKEEEQAKVKNMLATIEKDGGVTFTKKATDEDKLYDSVSNRSLLAYLSKEYGVTLQPSNFELDKIEALGAYTAQFTYQDISQEIPINVVKQTEVVLQETE